MARAGDVRNWNSHRFDRRARLLPMAAARRETCQSGLASACELFVYARKIKETANGSRRCACGEARQEVEVVAYGRVAPNGEVDERKRATTDGKDEAQGETHTQKQEKVEPVFLRSTVVRLKPRDLLAKKSMAGREIYYSPALSPCIAAVACVKGSKLTLLVPVKG